MITNPPPLAGRARLERLSDRPEVRAEIARLIRRGAVRVRPIPGDPDRVLIGPPARREPPPQAPAFWYPRLRTTSRTSLQVGNIRPLDRLYSSMARRNSHSAAE
jgi:hypothetical protein